MALSADSRPRRIASVLAIGALAVALDQITKTWAERRLSDRSIHVVWTLRLKLVLNPGVAFSLGQGSTRLVTVVALAVLVAVVVTAWRTSGRVLALALGLVIGGAAGNLADRLFRHNGGRVIDFIDLRWWPVFNVADMAISCGVVLALAVGVLSGQPAKTSDPGTR